MPAGAHLDCSHSVADCPPEAQSNPYHDTMFAAHLVLLLLLLLPIMLLLPAVHAVQENGASIFTVMWCFGAVGFVTSLPLQIRVVVFCSITGVPVASWYLLYRLWVAAIIDAAVTEPVVRAMLLRNNRFWIRYTRPYGQRHQDRPPAPAMLVKTCGNTILLFNVFMLQLLNAVLIRCAGEVTDTMTFRVYSHISIFCIIYGMPTFRQFTEGPSSSRLFAAAISETFFRRRYFPSRQFLRTPIFQPTCPSRHLRLRLGDYLVGNIRFGDAFWDNLGWEIGVLGNRRLGKCRLGKNV